MPRTLADALRPFTSYRSRTRGESLRSVAPRLIVHSSATSVSARVRGSASYEVSLTIEGHLLTPTCECPYFDGAFEPCKHIWALAIIADRQRLLVVPSDLDLDGSNLDLDAFDDLDMAGYAPPLDVRTPAPRPARVPVRPPWESFLAALPPPPTPPYAPDALAGELLYVFDPVRSTTTQGMHIELQRRQRKKNGEWAKPRDVTIARGDVKGLLNEDDREILERVCGADNAWAGHWSIGGSLPVPSPFVLTSSLQRDLIARLCGSGAPAAPADRIGRRQRAARADPLGAGHGDVSPGHHRCGRGGLHGDRRARSRRAGTDPFAMRCS